MQQSRVWFVKYISQGKVPSSLAEKANIQTMHLQQLFLISDVKIFSNVNQYEGPTVEI